MDTIQLRTGAIAPSRHIFTRRDHDVISNPYFLGKKSGFLRSTGELPNYQKETMSNFISFVKQKEGRTGNWLN